MTEKKIIKMIQGHCGFETEMNILRDCAVKENGAALDDNDRYCLLKKRLTLIEHWLTFLSIVEAKVLRYHLMEGRSWNSILAYLDSEMITDIGCDRRTLQRIQGRAIKKLDRFMRQTFGDSLDYLCATEGDSAL